MTPSQLEASAQAPCTSTITGLVPPLPPSARGPSGRAEAAWLERASAVAAARAAAMMAMMRRGLVGRTARARFTGCPFPGNGGLDSGRQWMRTRLSLILIRPSLLPPAAAPGALSTFRPYADDSLARLGHLTTGQAGSRSARDRQSPPAVAPSAG